MENIVKNEEAIINSIIEGLNELKLPALGKLNELIREKFNLGNISFASAAPEEKKQEEKKTSVALVLTAVGDQRIPVFNAIKEITGKSILEVKKLTDTLPFTIVSDLSQQKAEEIREHLVSKGSEVQIK